MSGLYKNVAGQKWVVFAFDRTDNTPKTGDDANITANLRIDGGAVNAVDDTHPTELEEGYYVFDMTQPESNGDMILMSPESSTPDIQVIGVPGVIFTRELYGTSLPDTLHVDPTNGNDSWAGDSRATPKATLAAAVSASSDGDTILLSAGTHALAAKLTWDTTLHIKGQGIGSTLITGSKDFKPGDYSSLSDCYLNARINLNGGTETAWTEFRMNRVWHYHVFDCIKPSGDCSGARVIATDCYFYGADTIHLGSAGDFHVVLNKCMMASTSGTLIATSSSTQCTIVMNGGLVVSGNCNAAGNGKIIMLNVGVQSAASAFTNIISSGVNYPSGATNQTDLFEGGAALAAGVVADAVWDEAYADHSNAGSFGILVGAAFEEV